MFADYAYERLLEKGYTPHAAAAAVGAWQQESGEDLDPLAVHDNGTGFGIAGWRDEKPGVGRKTNLLNWAEANNLDPNDIDTQIDYFDYEINEGDEKRVGDMLRNSENLDDATAAMVHFERPEGYDQNDVTKANGYDNRLANAKALFESYAGDEAASAVGLEDDSIEDSAPVEGEEGDIEFQPFDDDEKATKDDLAADEDVPEETTSGQRIGSMIINAGRQWDQDKQNVDYTPAGGNMEVDELPDTGIPVNAYQQYVPLYKDGGVVGEADIDEYFKMLGV